MMRITRIGDGDGGAERLRVEGRLTHDTVEQLRLACGAAIAELDVSGLQYVDAAGATLLQELQQAGVRLDGGSGFLVELLKDRDGDADVVARIRRGDAQAFEALVRRHGGRMLATARRYVRSEEDARDVVQEAFFAAFRAFAEFEGTSRVSTWLHRIVVNTSLMKLRSRRRRPEASIDELLPRFDETGHWAEPTSTWDAGAETLLERRETRSIVRAAIDRLPESHRMVLLLRDVEELDTEEAAAVLGASPNAVKTRLHRARQALRALLVSELGDAPVRRDAVGRRGAPAGFRS